MQRPAWYAKGVPRISRRTSDGPQAEFTGTFQGHDETDEVSGSGWAELNDDGTLNGEISFHLDDESTFKAQKC